MWVIVIVFGFFFIFVGVIICFIFDEIIVVLVFGVFKCKYSFKVFGINVFDDEECFIVYFVFFVDIYEEFVWFKCVKGGCFNNFKFVMKYFCEIFFNCSFVLSREYF